MNIAFRPESINLRLNPNDYEMDTVVGCTTDPYCLLTLQNRLTRYIYIRRIKRNALAVKNELIRLIKDNNLIVDSLTVDNDSENYLLDSVKNIRQIYHCNPYCSFEKGGIESARRFIRRYISKGKSMDEYNQENIIIMQDRINKIARHKLTISVMKKLFHLWWDTPKFKQIFKAINPNSKKYCFHSFIIQISIFALSSIFCFAFLTFLSIL